MNQVTDQQIIEILKKEAVPALGCTEPVACALACAKCKEVLEGPPYKGFVNLFSNFRISLFVKERKVRSPDFPVLHSYTP